MKFKLTKLHLFLILLTVLIFSSLGIRVLEGMNIIEGNSNLEDSAEAAPSPEDLAAGGQEGVERAINQYRLELERGMKLMGCTKISDLNRNNLRYRRS